jgi:hypothetical protein
VSRDLNVGSTAADFLAGNWSESLENLMCLAPVPKTPLSGCPSYKKKDSTNTKQKSWKSEKSSDVSKNDVSYHGLPQIHNSCFNAAIFWHLQWLSLYFLVSKPLSSPSSHGLSLTS